MYRSQLRIEQRQLHNLYEKLHQVSLELMAPGLAFAAFNPKHTQSMTMFISCLVGNAGTLATKTDQHREK